MKIVTTYYDNYLGIFSSQESQ